MDTTLTKPRESGASVQADRGLILVHVFPPARLARAQRAKTVCAGGTIGRRCFVEDTVNFGDPHLSRCHALFEHVSSTHDLAKSLVVHDASSRNGLWVNGRCVGSHPLVSGDVLRCGDTMFVAAEARPIAATMLRQCKFHTQSVSLLEAEQALRSVARSGCSVLVLGETGTGKEVFARALHAASGRPGPLVPVNCASLPRDLADSLLFGCEQGAFTGAQTSLGHVRTAHKGTLFLDELGELERSVQARLLRFLETGEVMPLGTSEAQRVDVRLVAATNKASGNGDLGAALRSDLLYRLQQETILLPPLRKRKEDIVLLLRRRFADRLGNRLQKLCPEVAHAFLVHDWPGNVRELYNRMESYLNRKEAGMIISLPSVPSIYAPPESVCVPPPLDRPQVAPPTSWGGKELARLLEEDNWNISRAARSACMHRRQLQRLIKRFGLSKPTDQGG